MTRSRDNYLENRRVGIYPRRKFVHVDVGNFRSWVGDLFSPEPEFYLEGYGELFAGESLPWDVAA